ncbi:MOZ/SAS family protein [Necator americanus]|uniref:Histone acetyltransferase n=1 Tax=Necator americanus TaxID=51031 RepID=W2SSE7_NECAM|nr:MOZ/SAS family protein [Necator americanus]ETN72428.1 MOZ/SAS family protein [Necator americanus]
MNGAKAAAAKGSEGVTTRMDDVKINERVVVWRVVNGEKRRVLATLLKKRVRGPKSEADHVSEKKTELDANIPAGEVNNVVSESLEYFVHFDGQDRRLDQWISGDQFIEMAPKHSAGELGGGDTRLTRKRRKNDEELISLDDPGRVDQHRKAPPEKNIEWVVFGSYEIQCWYYSPYRLKKKAVEKLYVCENCLLYTDDVRMYKCHLAVDCKRTNPPGELIYEEGDVQIYEVFGALQKFYCQRLCLLAKLFIDHKTLCFDVENFIFYLLCETDKEGTHIAAMFSKEMHSSNNLACIMTLPCYQRKGYGNLLIQLSMFVL